MSTSQSIFQQYQPQLASTLYRHEQHRHNDNHRPNPSLKTGIPQLDGQITLPVNAVIGLASTEDASHARTLLTTISTTHLLTTTSHLFLVEPPGPNSNSTLLDIYASLSTTTDTNPLTSRISLLRPLDLLGVLQALAEIAATETKGLVVLRGLGACVLASRIGGEVRTAAVLEGVVRAVRRLKGCGGTVLVECGVGIDVRGDQQHPQHGIGVGVRLRSAFSSAVGKKMRLVLEGHGHGHGQSQTDGDSAMEVGGGSARYLRERMPLVRMVEDLLDVLVVVHDGFGVTDTKERRETSMEKRIVEVVKDESGGGLGHWAAWDVKRGG